MELDDKIYSVITDLAEQGNKAMDEKDYDRALEFFSRGLRMLPEPIAIWPAATWFFAGIGDAYFLSGRFQKALPVLLGAMRCAESIGNPFLDLRLGQVHFELGNEALSADELTRAYMAQGADIFREEDPKYFEFLKTKLREPPGGW